MKTAAEAVTPEAAATPAPGAPPAEAATDVPAAQGALLRLASHSHILN